MEHPYRVRRQAKGFTLVEMMVAMLASSLMFLALTGVLAGNQTDYNRTYERMYGDIENHAREARIIFDQVVRQSTIRKCLIGTANEYVEVYYYRTTGSLGLDGYARFYWDVSDEQLLLERGQLELGTFEYSLWNDPTTQVVAEHVTSCTFLQVGVCISMNLVLDDGRTNLPVVVTAMRHNE